MEIINYNKSESGRDYKLSDIMPNLSKGGIFWLLIAPRGSGKTNLILNLLSDNFLGREFDYDHRFVFTKSLSADASYDPDTFPAKYIYSDFKEDIILSIMDQQKKIKQEYGPKAVSSILVLIDDFAGENILNKKNILETLAIRGRHYGITVIITAQKFSSVGRVIRVNTDVITFFQPRNDSETDYILDEYAGKAKDRRKQFLKMFSYATDEPYSFFHIDFTKPKKYRYMRNFEELLDIKDFEIKK